MPFTYNSGLITSILQKFWKSNLTTVKAGKIIDLAMIKKKNAVKTELKPVRAPAAIPEPDSI